MQFRDANFEMQSCGADLGYDFWVAILRCRLDARI